MKMIWTMAASAVLLGTSALYNPTPAAASGELTV